MTDIERFVFGVCASSGSALLVHKLDLRDAVLRISFVDAKGTNPPRSIVFRQASLTSLWLDEQSAIEWPLELIGFDCYRDADIWRFVLNAGEMELVWRSPWPSLLSEDDEVAA